jgi:hypothetical protein
MWIRGTAGPCREGAFAYANRPETAPIAPKPPPKTNLSMCTSSQQITRMLLNLQMKVPISGSPNPSTRRVQILHLWTRKMACMYMESHENGRIEFCKSDPRFRLA